MALSPEHRALALSLDAAAPAPSDEAVDALSGALAKARQESSVSGGESAA